MPTTETMRAMQAVNMLINPNDDCADADGTIRAAITKQITQHYSFHFNLLLMLISLG